MTTAPKRRWSFSLRMLFVVVTVLATLLSWIAYNLNWIRQRHALLARSRGHTDGFASPPGALWLFGEQGFGEVEFIFVVDHFEDQPFSSYEDFMRVQRAFPEARICGTMYTQKSWDLQPKRRNQRKELGEN
jgi:hypothetical protein